MNNQTALDFKDANKIGFLGSRDIKSTMRFGSIKMSVKYTVWEFLEASL